MAKEICGVVLAGGWVATPTTDDFNQQASNACLRRTNDLVKLRYTQENGNHRGYDDLEGIQETHSSHFLETGTGMALTFDTTIKYKQEVSRTHFD